MTIKYPTTPRIPVLAAIAAAVATSPDGTIAQESLRHQDIRAFGAAVEEARRSPFHAGIATDAPPVLRPAGFLAPHPPHEVAQAAPDGRSSFNRVFWPTLAVAYLADYAAFLGLYVAALNESGTGMVLSVTGAVLVPGVVAGATSKRVWPSLLGSMVGAGGALILMMAASDLFILAPALHAILTTALARL